MATAAARECLGGEPALHLHKFILLLRFAHVISGALGRKGQVRDCTTRADGLEQMYQWNNTKSWAVFEVFLSQGLGHKVVTVCLFFARDP